MRLALLLMLLAAAPAQAQLLVSGTWTGTLADGRVSTPASAAIERCATGFSVALTTAGRTVRTEPAARVRASRSRRPPMAASAARSVRARP